MSGNAKPAPIIVIKKKGGHGGHHGGAWKVAYADFVTAMMSLFIVLWLMGSSEKVKKAVSGYFNDPKGTGQLMGTLMEGKGEALEKVSTKDLEELKEKIEKEIKERKELESLSKQIEIKITPEGLRIELIEGKNGTFFQSGSAALSEDGGKLLTLLAGELKGLPNNLLIEGHTDSLQYSHDANYSNWELSADRANSARRLMQGDGVRSDQVTQVRGYADQIPRDGHEAADPTNRRISILVKNAGDKEHPKVVTADEAHALGVVKQASAPPEPPKAAEGSDKKEGAAGEKKAPEAAHQPAAAAGHKPTAEAEPKAAEAPASQKAPPAANPSATKPSLMERLKAMIPGKKK